MTGATCMHLNNLARFNLPALLQDLGPGILVSRLGNLALKLQAIASLVSAGGAFFRAELGPGITSAPAPCFPL
jgi:hypothetical protein